MTTTEYPPNLMILTEVALTKRSLKVSHILWSSFGARQVRPGAGDNDDDEELFSTTICFQEKRSEIRPNRRSPASRNSFPCRPTPPTSPRPPEEAKESDDDNTFATICNSEAAEADDDVPSQFQQVRQREARRRTTALEPRRRSWAS